MSLKCVGPVITYKVVYPKTVFLSTWEGKLILDLFEHERMKPAILRTSQGNVVTLPQLKQVLYTGIRLT